MSHKPLFCLALFACATLLAAGCDTSVSPENPYDPDVPLQQKDPATLIGSVALERGDAASATVEVRPSGKYATPDSDGTWIVNDLTPGSYTVLVSAAGHSSQTRAGVYCDVGQTVDLGQIALLAARGSVDGSVLLMESPDVEADAHGGAIVNVRPRSAGRLAAGEGGQSTVSNPDGSWSITGLPVGTYTVSGSKDGYAPSLPVEAVVHEDGTTTVSAMVLRAITGIIEINGGDEFTNAQDGAVTVRVLAFETDEMQLSESSQPSADAWVPHLAETSFTLTGDDGVKALYAWFRNSDGFETPAVHDTIVLDRAAPVGASVGIGDGAAYVTDATVGLSLHAEDALSGVAEMRIALDGDISGESWASYETHRTVTLPVGADPDGVSATVAVQFRDGAGNESEVAQASVIVDAVAPSTPAIVIEGGAALTASQVVTLSLSAQGAAEMQVSNDSGLAGAFWQPYVGSLAWGLTDGDEVKTVYARFRDAAGNQSDIVQDSIELNTRGAVSASFLLEGAAADGHGGITVSLGTDPERTAATAADGAVTFTDVPVGLYSLRATHPGYQGASAPLFSVEPGQTAALGSFVLSVARGGLSGTARREGADADEHGGILVEVVGLPGKAAVTNPQGEWAVADIPVAQYTVRATAEGYGAAEQSDVSVAADTVTTVPELLLAADPGSVSGGVTLEGEQAPDLGGVEISVAGRVGHSQADGSFAVPDVPAGTHPLRASLDGFGAVQTVVTVLAGEEADAGTIALKIARGAIAGTATLAGASDHSGIAVGVDGTGYAGVSNGDGSYRIESVPVGTYSLTARRDGYVTKTVGNLTVLEDETVDAASVELVQQSGDFRIQERASGDEQYLDDPEVTLVFSVVPPDSNRILVSEDSGFAGATWQAFSGTTHDHDLTGADGTITVFVKFKSTGDQESPVFSSSAVLDREPPRADSSVVINSDAEWTVDPNVSLTLVGLDDISGVEMMRISLDGLFDTETDEAFKATESTRLDDGDDGLKTVWVEFVDRAGNRSAAAATDTIYLDRNAPVNDGLTIEGGATHTTQVLVTLALSAEDACDTGYPSGNCTASLAEPAQMMLSNEPGFPGAVWEAYAAERAWFLKPGDGAKQVHVKFRDGAGNATTPISAAITLDQTAPASPQVTVQGGEVTGSPLVDLALSASPDPIEMIIAENGDFASASWEPFAATKSGFTLTGDDGVKTVSVKFRDEAGNESAVATDTVLLDQQAPTNTSLLIDGGALFSTAADGQVTLTLGAEDTLSGVARMRFSNDGVSWDAWQPYAGSYGPWVLGGFASQDDVEKRVYVEFEDAAGNASASVYDRIRLDNVAPTIDAPGLEIDGDAQYTVRAMVVLSLPATGAAEMKIGAGAGCVTGGWETYVATRDWAVGDADGDSVTVSAQVRDAAGNLSNCSEDAIVVDTEAPVAQSITLNGCAGPAGGDCEGAGGGGDRGHDPYYTSDENVGLTVEVNGTCQTIEVSHRLDFLSGVTSYPCTQSFPVVKTVSTVTGDGPRSMYARALDAAGNRSNVVSAQAFYDATAPEYASLLIEGGAAYTDQTSVDVAIAGQDSGSGLYWMYLDEDAAPLDGESAAFAPSYSGFSFSAPHGVSTVYAMLEDLAGNQTHLVSDSIYVDTLPPNAPSITKICRAGQNPATCPPLERIGSTAVLLVLDASDQSQDGADIGSGIAEMKIAEGNTADALETVSWQPFVADAVHVLDSTNGDKKLWVAVRDKVGRETQAASASQIVLDTEPPFGLELGFDPVGYSASLDVLGSVNAEDNLDTEAELEVFVSGQVAAINGDSGLVGDWVPLSSVDNQTWTLAAGQGDKAVHLVVRDRAGNASQTDATAQIYVDLTPPTAPSIVYTQGGNRSAEIYWTAASDDGSGLAMYIVRYGTAPGVYTGELQVPPDETFTTVTGLDNDVEYYFVVEARDFSARSAQSGEAMQLTGWRQGTIVSRPGHKLEVKDVVYAGQAIYVLYTDTVSGLGAVVWLARSDDEGASWRTTPVSVDAFYQRHVAGLAVTSDRVVVVYSGTLATLSSSDVWAATSYDGGLTWTYSQLASNYDYMACIADGQQNCLNLDNHSGVLTFIYWRNTGNELVLMSQRDPDFAFTIKDWASDGSMSGGVSMHADARLVLLSTTDNDGWLECRTVTNLDAIGGPIPPPEASIVYGKFGMATRPSTVDGTHHVFAAYAGEAGELGLAYTADGCNTWDRYDIGAAGTIDVDVAPAAFAANGMVYVFYIKPTGELMLTRADSDGAGTWRTSEMVNSISSGPLAVAGYTANTLFAVYGSAEDTDLHFITNALPAPRIEGWLASTGPIPEVGVKWHSLEGAERFLVYNDDTDPPFGHSFFTAATTFQGTDRDLSFFAVAGQDALGQPGQSGAIWEAAPFDTHEADAQDAVENQPGHGGVAADSQYGYFLSAGPKLILSRIDRSTGAETQFDIETASDVGYRAMTMNKFGTLYVLYQVEDRDGTHDVAFARSENQGKNWSKVLVDIGQPPSRPDNDVGYDLDIVCDGADGLAAAWRNVSTNLVELKYSTDAGDTWVLPPNPPDKVPLADEYVRMGSVSSTGQFIKLVYASQGVLFFAHTEDWGAKWNAATFTYVPGQLGDVALANGPRGYLMAVMDEDGRTNDRLRVLVNQLNPHSASMWSDVTVDRDVTALATYHQVAAVATHDGYWVLYTPGDDGPSPKEVRIAYCHHDCAGPDGWSTGTAVSLNIYPKGGMHTPRRLFDPMLATSPDGRLFGSYIDRTRDIMGTWSLAVITLEDGAWRRTW